MKIRINLKGKKLIYVNMKIQIHDSDEQNIS